MRRSAHVIAPLLASAAVAVLAGCRGPEMQRCVDEQNHVVDPSLCKNLPPTGAQTITGMTPNSSGYYSPHVYRFYYGGGGGYTPGSFAGGGGYFPSSGHSYSMTSGTSRGGFGSSFSGEGHGGGGE